MMVGSRGVPLLNLTSTDDEVEDEDEAEDGEDLYNHITESPTEKELQSESRMETSSTPPLDLEAHKTHWVLEFKSAVSFQASKHLEEFRQGLQSQGEEAFDKWMQLTTRPVERLFGQEKQILEQVSVRTTSLVIFALLSLRDVSPVVIRESMQKYSERFSLFLWAGKIMRDQPTLDQRITEKALAYSSGRRKKLQTVLNPMNRLRNWIQTKLQRINFISPTDRLTNAHLARFLLQCCGRQTDKTTNFTEMTGILLRAAPFPEEELADLHRLKTALSTEPSLPASTPTRLLSFE
jgi:hypothetical protein